MGRWMMQDGLVVIIIIMIVVVVVVIVVVVMTAQDFIDLYGVSRLTHIFHLSPPPPPPPPPSSLPWLSTLSLGCTL